MRVLRSVLTAGGLAGVLVILIALSGAERADAASLIADYRFDDSYESSVGTAPPLQPLPPSGPFSTVTLGGVPDRVASWQEGGGFAYLGPIPDPGSYSVIATFAIDDLSGYRRILAFDALAQNSDHGFYYHDGALDLYDDNDHEGAVKTANGAFADVAFTRAGNTAIGYLDGVQQFIYPDTTGISVIGPDGLRFFRDNGSEQSNGRVARIRIYSGELSADEVAHIEQAGGRPPGASAQYDPKLIVKKGKHGRKIKGIDTGVLAACPADAAPCPVSAKVTAKVKGKQKTIGTLSASVAEDSSQDVALKISKRGRKLIAAKGKLPVSCTVTVTAPDGETASAGGQRKL